MAAHPRSMHTTRPPMLSVVSDDVPNHGTADRSIGDIIRINKNLTDEQIQGIVEYQRSNGVRFGEATVALGLATDQDVVYALSQQFQYPYTPEARREFSRELVVAAQPFSKQAEAFRAIRSQLMMRVYGQSQAEPKRAISVVSAESGDGKTFFTANLGVALAQLGGRTLIMDADMRHPRLHQVFGIPNSAGLSGILSGRQEDNVIFQAPDIPSLFIMPLGIIPPNPLELIERPAFRLLITELLRKFDHVVVDTTAATYGMDGNMVAAKCGAALAVARKGKSRIAMMQQMMVMLDTSTTKLAGVVFNEY